MFPCVVFHFSSIVSGCCFKYFICACFVMIGMWFSTTSKLYLLLLLLFSPCDSIPACSFRNTSGGCVSALLKSKCVHFSSLNW